MTTIKTAAIAAVSAAAIAPVSSFAASEEDTGRIEVGYLECVMSSDEGNIIVSEQEFLCTFDPAVEGRANEQYVANFDKIGLDLSATTSETIRWGVFAPAEKYEAGVLEGDYAGVSADIALGGGIGAKALVGGFEDSIALQPLSVSTQEGIGVSLAVETLSLSHVKTEG